MIRDLKFLTDDASHAAEYLRKSTDHQKYSIENQADTIRRYAEIRGFTIVRTYADDGKSGLTINGRPALRRLIQDVRSGRANFQTILVYDVSRWGRFQDADESAYHEFLCKLAGIKVEYCAEQFENDGTPISTIIKGMKRAMAGEYSRELSVKVFAGKSRLNLLGYRTGGLPGYGLRRQLIDQNGAPRIVLEHGQWKCISTDRVVLIPGPPDEIATVLWIFSEFVHHRKSEQEIADALNARGIANTRGGTWKEQSIRKMLKNEKYIGHNVWNRTSAKLKGKLVVNHPNAWVRAENAFQALLPKALFEAAQAIYRERVEHPPNRRRNLYSDDQLLLKLQRLLRRRGYLSKPLLDRTSGIPCASTYVRRFGALTALYKLIGYKPQRRQFRAIRRHRIGDLPDEIMLEKLRSLLAERGELSHAIVAESSDVPSRGAYVSRFGSLTRAYELIGYKPHPYRRHSVRPHGLSDDEMLNALRKLLYRHGHLTRSIIESDKTVPSSYAYEQRFGGLRRAFRMVGYIPNSLAGLWPLENHY